MSNNNSGNSPFNLSTKMFARTDNKSESIRILPLDKLQAFKNHPFKLYNGERFLDMVESIKANGVLVPIIVRIIDDAIYEILSGHNRVEAAKTAGLEEIQAIIKDNLSDEEALLIVTETNLLQRSFSELSHSERAITLAMHFEAIKKQGKRSDIVTEVEAILNTNDNNDSETSLPVDTKYDSYEKMKMDYGLSKDSIARYIRVSKLNENLLIRLDNGEIPLRTAVIITFLKDNEQKIVDDVLESGNYKLDIKKAEILRKLSEGKTLTYETAESVFENKTTAKKTTNPKSIKIKSKTVSQFFNEGQKQKEIEETIVKALTFYFANTSSENTEETAVDKEDTEFEQDLSDETRKTETTENDS